MEGKSRIAKELSAYALTAALLCAAQALALRGILYVALALFLLLAAWSARRERALPCLLFFLPWSTLLKTAPGALSVYTFALLLAGAVRFVRARFQLHTAGAVLALALLSLSLLARAVAGGGLPDLSYPAFFYMMVVLPLFAGETRQKDAFHCMTVFFAVGICGAALASWALEGNPHLQDYIQVKQQGLLLRRSGFYGDPNFYAAQVTAAISGTILLASAKRRRPVLLLLPPLLVCGAISLSKSFALMLAVVLLLWLAALFRERRPGRWALLAILVILTASLLSSTLPGSLDLLRLRFAGAESLSALTTGRSRHWLDYMQAIFSDPRRLLLGQGFSQVNLNGWGSHSTPLQTVYQFGLPGALLLLGWLYSLFNEVMGQLRVRRPLRAAVLFAGVYLPWLALDLLFFDDFFLLSAYAFAGVRAMCTGSDDGLST